MRELEQLKILAGKVGWSVEVHHCGGFSGAGEATLEGHGLTIMAWADAGGHASVTVVCKGDVSAAHIKGNYGTAITQACRRAAEATPPPARLARFLESAAARYAEAAIPLMNPAWDDESLCRVAYWAAAA